MISQIDIRYSISDTVADVKTLVNAFPGNLTLCLETSTLYQYKEYNAEDKIPVPDDKLVIQTNDSALLSRWIAVGSYTSKSLSGSFSIDDWVFNAANNTYTYTVQFPNIVDGFTIKFLDSTNKEVYLEDVISTLENNKVASVIGVIGATPDCRFSGSYFICFDKLS